MHLNNKYRFIIAAGGTGGHLFPALAVVDKLKELSPDSDFLFIGTKDKIESRVIPNNGYKFQSISVVGFARKLSLKNVLFPFKLALSLLQALKINMNFKPNIAIGSGAYVSGPVLWAAKVMGAKVVLLEQNSFPGVTNRILEKKASEVYLSFEESKKYFRQPEKLFVMGNPTRNEIVKVAKEVALKKIGFENRNKTILIIGGSLGAKSINEAIKANLKKFAEEKINLIWQVGQNYIDEFRSFSNDNVKVLSFIEDMQSAYSSADIVIARAGASTIAEVANLGKAVIFIPSPNVAANHQFKNAEALFNKNAAILLKDTEVSEKIFFISNELLNNENKILELETNIKQFSNLDTAEKIANRILKLAI